MAEEILAPYRFQIRKAELGKLLPQIGSGLQVCGVTYDYHLFVIVYRNGFTGPHRDELPLGNSRLGFRCWL